MKSSVWLAAILGYLVFAAGCGKDEDEAIKRGVGAECTTDTDCTEKGQRCLSFKGGYCGIAGCKADSECPTGSACVAHDNGMNYCFLLCAEKVDCNVNRSVANESNCVGSITFVEGKKEAKACEPPSSK